MFVESCANDALLVPDKIIPYERKQKAFGPAVQFIKDVHAGFQLLNLKNDMLRKRSDGIKYKVGF